MDATEYLAFLPLLIYGIALADLFGQWKRLFEPKKVFVPYILFTMMLTELAVYNVFAYAELVDNMHGLQYYQYLIKLIPPFLFMLTVNAFTPEKGDDTKEYFMQKMPHFFTMLAAFMATLFFYDFNENAMTVVSRIIGIALVLIAGYTRKIWLCYCVIALWLMFITFRTGFVISL